MPTTDRQADREAAVAVLARDGAVAFPTETVWGLAVRARSEAAMSALRDWKGRDAGQPISILVPGASVLAELGFSLTPLAERLVEAFWPGPLTLVVAGGVGLASGVARADGAVGLRCSAHPVAAGLAEAAFAAGLGPLTATSLNRSGDPPATSEAEARSLCKGPAAPHVFVGDPLAGDRPPARPTTVLDLTTDPPRMLRVGAIDGAALAPYTNVAQDGPSGDLPA